MKFATFFTWDALGDWCPSENIQKNNELVQNRAVIHFTFVILGRLVNSQLLVGWKTLLSLIFVRVMVINYLSYYLFTWDIFGLFFIRIAWRSNIRISFTELSNVFSLGRGFIRGYPLCGSC